MENEKEQLTTSAREATGYTDNPDLSENAQAGSEGAAVSPTSATTSEIMAEYEKLKKDKAELYERLLRKQAEMDNFRKRTQREKEEFHQYATEDLIRTLLPVLDGFERALKQRASGVPEPFYQGMELIYRQLLDVLARAGLEALETAGELFDPHYHQAIEMVEDATRRDHEIVEEMQRGYKLRNRLLRPAIVKVAVNPRTAGSRDSEEPRK